MCILDRWYEKGQCRKDWSEQQFPKQIPSTNIHKVWPLFAVLAAGILATGVASLVEVIHFQKKGKVCMSVQLNIYMCKYASNYLPYKNFLKFP